MSETEMMKPNKFPVDLNPDIAVKLNQRDCNIKTDYSFLSPSFILLSGFLS
jgi:hypothetical protein